MNVLPYCCSSADETTEIDADVLNSMPKWAQAVVQTGCFNCKSMTQRYALADFVLQCATVVELTLGLTACVLDGGSWSCPGSEAIT